MATQFEVSDRSIRRDIAVLQSAGFDIQELIGDRNLKRWKMTPFSEQLQFNYADLIAVVMSRRFLEPLAGTPFWEGHQKIYQKVRGALGENAFRFCDKLHRMIRITGFGSSDYSKRGQIIDTIIQAMEDKRRVLIVYQSMQATEPVEQELGPQGLIWHNGSLYLIAWSARRQEIRNYKIDRIEDAEIGSDLKYAVPETFSLEEWQQRAFGVFHGGGVDEYTVVIHFSRDAARYVQEAHWHESQKFFPHQCRRSSARALQKGPPLFAFTVAPPHLLIKDFGRFVEQQSERLKSHAEKLAETLGRRFEYINGKLRKDDYAKEIAKRDGITQGLICVLRILEPCQSFSVVPAEKRPKLVNATRKCLCYYFYFLDRDFGLMHVRIQSWFPLVIQICLNGHEWLARKLDKHGIEYRKQDNAFLWISDCARAQKFADRMETTNWPRVFSAIARRVNPLLKDVLAGMEYYWVMDQAEYATDVMFRDAEALKAPYEDLLKHATLCFSAEDVLTFLGRKMHGRFEGEVLTDMKKKRFPGARVKHRMTV